MYRSIHPAAAFINFSTQGLTQDAKIPHNLSGLIDRALKEASIPIPFPQRDLHVISMPNPAKP